MEADCHRCGQRFTMAVPSQRLCHDPCMPRRSGTAQKAQTPDEAGYGSEHRQARRAALAAWVDGDPCARCRQPMRHGSPVDLDHTDDRTGYLGLSHAACNRSRTGSLERVRRDERCEHCGQMFLTRWQRQMYCSVPCRKAARKPRPRPRKLVLRTVIRPPRSCVDCGARFIPRQRGSIRCRQGRHIPCAVCAAPIGVTATTRPAGEAICHPCRPIRRQKKSLRRLQKSSAA